MTKRKYAGIPTVDDLYAPTLQALKNLGGSANIDELNEEVYKIMHLPEKILSIPHGDGRTKVEYRLAWARTRLKLIGYVDNSSRAIWALHKSSSDISKITNAQIISQLRSHAKQVKSPQPKGSPADVGVDPKESAEVWENWKELLLKELFNLSAEAFERLTQRILRESGFIQVEVTGKSGDGGIDGKGIFRLNGILSFYVVFQCKRYKGLVSAGQIRDFRGAMQGRTDKGMFITTGNFTRDALKEATRDGTSPIDLIDGDLLCEKLKELRLGVNIELKENVTVISDWFQKL